MDELIIQANAEALTEFKAFADQHEAASIETSQGLDGQKIIELAIENAPAIITAITALIGALRAKGFTVKLQKNGKPINELNEV
jgi:hypothetical protein